MYKLGLQKAEEPKINLQHSLAHRESGEFQKNADFLSSDPAEAPDCARVCVLVLSCSVLSDSLLPCGL